MTNSTRKRPLPLWILCIALVFVAFACGKKGPPVPQDQKNTFAWHEAQATLNEQGTFSIVATLTGMAKNVDSFTLELEPIVDEVCVGCPFAPREVVILKPDSAIENGDSVSYNFSYTASSEAPVFRWRLVARNIHTGFPHAITPLKTLYRDGIPAHIVPFQR